MITMRTLVNYINALSTSASFWQGLGLFVLLVFGSLNLSIKSLHSPSLDKTHNSASLEFKPDPHFKRRSALKDPENRISVDFKVPRKLRSRVGFWFDIYTKYDSDSYVLHHVKYPWIVFKVYDLKDFYIKGRSNRRNRIRAKKVVRAKKRTIKNVLRRLSSKKSFKRLTRLERKLYRALGRVRGSRKNVFKTAANNLRFQVGQKNFIATGIQYSQNYLPYMEQIFKNQNLPTELTRIPFVESSFNIKAYSKVGASGIWQIMPAMGKRKLKINKLVDERNSPLKATKYAALHLKQDFMILKNWPFTVTAYNHGAGGLLRGSRKLRTSSLAKLISGYTTKSFQFASKNFYTSFLAALHAEKYHEEIYGIYKNKPHVFETLRLGNKISSNAFIKLLGLAKKNFLTLNYDLKHIINKNYNLPRNLDIFLPKGSKRLYNAKKPNRSLNLYN